MFAAHLCLGNISLFNPPLLACLSSSSQDIVELRRFRLAGAEEIGRLNYIFIGNPGTGKMRRAALSVLYPSHLSMHDTASHLHALPRAAVLQTSIARVCVRLLGQLGLRTNAENESEEQKALADATAAAGAASAKSDDDHARDALALRMLQVDAEKHGAAIMAAQLIFDTARAARDAAATYEEGIRGSSVSPPDKPGTRHKATMELRPSARRQMLWRRRHQCRSSVAKCRGRAGESAQGDRSCAGSSDGSGQRSAASASAAAAAAQAAAAVPPQRV